jgi:toxin ParE1/3/4
VNKYTLSNRTKLDIKKIATHGMEDFGEAQTIKYMASFKEKMQFLANYPEVGREFLNSRTGNQYLFFPHESHVIYYRKRQDDIFVVRILHHKMLPEKHL